MIEATVSPLIAWANFYVIVGSSAGALTGLTFVVITLTVRRQTQAVSWGVETFTTPTVVHFSAALFVAATLSAPWPAFTPVAVLLGLCGIYGMVYGAIVVRRMRRQVGYQPVGEDWVWFAWAPLAVYAALLVLAFVLPSYPTPALFGIAGLLMALLFMGIRNAWDVVTYVAIGDFGQQAEPTAQAEPTGAQVEARAEAKE